MKSLKKGARVRVIGNEGNETFYQVGAKGSIVRWHRPLTSSNKNEVLVRFDEGENVLECRDNSWWVMEDDLEQI